MEIEETNMTRDEYYGLSIMATDLLQMHGIEIPRENDWDDEVSQEILKGLLG